MNDVIEGTLPNIGRLGIGKISVKRLPVRAFRKTCQVSLALKFQPSGRPTNHRGRSDVHRSRSQTASIQ
jgi:hypothetical protein